ncbi:histidinol-phosphate transaminase [Olsenella profusa]|uniref:Histidinol-phosphate aminotransferase n=2 Tax=Olsenella profusa TaxID=138595 RepID=A0ABS2F1S2_9ACTN|nr:histidinol-phosphate transaminase [Olsenella profusa]MBM6774890.1 histidinol-phosphate transaminase [Olsenella profusa]
MSPAGEKDREAVAARPTAAGSDVTARLREALRSFEPYDPAFTPCRVNLSANENTHALPAEVADAIREVLLATPLNRYPDPMANDLRDEVARRHGTDRAHVIVGNGGDELLFNLLFAFGGPGRSVVTCPPDFAEYANFAAMCETEVRPVWRDAEDFSIDADALVAAARDAALVILTSPNNPTGDLVDPALVRRLLDETDALVLVDEAYVEFAGDGASLDGWVGERPRLVVLRTLSKAFGLAGVRVGYLLADPAVVDALGAVRQIYSVDVLAQAAGLAALTHREALAGVVADIVSERERLLASLADLPGVRTWPSAANFVLVRLPHAAEVRRRLRDEHSILVRDFSAAPGLADCLRLTVGTREENDALLDALAVIRRDSPFVS